MPEIVNPYKRAAGTAAPAKTIINPYKSTGAEPDAGRGIGGVVSDLGVSAAAGVNTAVKSVGDIYGVATGNYDNALSRQGERGRDYWNEKKTPELQQMEAMRQAKIDAAEGELAKAGTALWETVKSPTLWTSFLAEQAPMLIPVGVGGRVTGAVAGRIAAGEVTGKAAAKGMSQEATERAVQRFAAPVAATAGTAGAVGTGAAMHGSETGSSVYSELMALPDELWQVNDDLQALVSDGLDYEQAKEALAQRYSQQAAFGAGAVSVLTNMLPGARVLEQRLAGNRLTGSTAGNVVRGFAGETLQEGLEEGTGQAMTNLGTARVDPNQSVSEGVGEATAMGALSGPFGAVAGAATQKPQEQSRVIRNPYKRDNGVDFVAPGAPDPVETVQPDMSRAVDMTTDTIDLTTTSMDQRSVAAGPVMDRAIDLDIDTGDLAVRPDTPPSLYDNGVEFDAEPVRAQPAPSRLQTIESPQMPTVEGELTAPAAPDLSTTTMDQLSRSGPDMSRAIDFERPIADLETAQETAPAAAPVESQEPVKPVPAPLVGAMLVTREPVAPTPEQLARKAAREQEEIDSARVRRFVTDGSTLAEIRRKTVETLGEERAAEMESVIKSAWNSKQQEKRRAIKPDDSLATAVAKLGGLSTQWRQDIIGDTKGNKSVPGVGAVFTQSGSSPDDMALRLMEAGYLTQQQLDDMDARDVLYEALNDELSGRRVKYQLSSDRAAEQALAEREEEYLAQMDAERAAREQEYAAIAAEHGSEAADLARQFDEDMDAYLADLDSALELANDALTQQRTRDEREEIAATDAATSDQQLREEGPGVSDDQGEAPGPVEKAEPPAKVRQDSPRAAASPEAVVASGSSIETAAQEAATSPENDLPEPTEAQKEAGNYRKGHLSIQGLDISVENPKGSTRSGTSPDGTRWENTMAHHYGYIKRTTGADGEQIDVFVGPDTESQKVYIVDQVNPDNSFDEHKVMIGFKDKLAARMGYQSNYSKGWKVGPITEMTMDQFKTWLREGNNRKPVSNKVLVKKKASPPKEKVQIAAAPKGDVSVSGQSKPDREKSKGPVAPIEDFGELIKGAKKDTWGLFREKMDASKDVDIATVPLSKSWPEPDYQKLLDEGADPWAVAFMRAARDEVPNKPQVSRRQRMWVEQVSALRDLAYRVADGSTSPEVVRKMLKDETRGLMGFDGRVDLYLAVGHSQSLKGIKLDAASYSLYKGKSYSPPKTFWSVSQSAKKTSMSNFPRELAVAETRDGAIAQFKERFASLTLDKPAAKQVQFNIYSKRGQDGFFIGKKLGRNYIDLERFDDVKEARAYLRDQQEALLAKLEKAKEIPQLRRDTNNPRAGEDMRGGLDVTPQMFTEAFGFRGVQFGNWVEGKRRQADLNNAYDALMDMAAILEIPPRSLSLNGQLGLAFGARGSGGVDPAAAHYERGHVVINLTKKQGAGSLGHEWWHALDNYFSRLRGKGDSYMTEASDVSLAARDSKYFYQGAVRKEMIDAFGRVMNAIHSTAMKARSSKLDKRRSKEYWTTDVEMSARAFETYLIAKLHDQNASNDYLANIVDAETWAAAESLGFELDDTYPYPTAGEIPAIRAGFDEFFNTIESRETENGVALFSNSIQAGPGQPGTTVAVVERAIARPLQKLKAEFDVTVVQRIADLPWRIRSQIEEGARIKGVYLEGEVYLIADNIRSAHDANVVLAHELVGHKGVLEMINQGEWTELKGRIDTLVRSGNRAAVSMAAEVDRRYPDDSGDVWYAEFMAIAAERRQKDGPIASLLRTLREYLQRALKAFGFDGLFSASDLDIMLSNAERFLAGRGQEQDAVSAGALASRGEQTAIDSPAFKRWFGESKVVDGNGDPLVVYHGTNQDFTAFDQDKRGSNTVSVNTNLGFFFIGNRQLAENFARETNGGTRVIEAYLSIKKPIVLKTPEIFNDSSQAATVYEVMTGERLSPDEALEAISDEIGLGEYSDLLEMLSSDEAIAIMRRDGYDGVFSDFGGGNVEYIAFDPSQIKSATANSGAFDPASPSMLASQDGFALDQYTEEEIAQQEAARRQEQQAAAERDQRAQADEQSGDFTLTGSDAPADQAAARGQLPLFSQGDTGFAVPDETLVSVAIRKMQDKFKVLKDLQANIRAAGGTVTEDNDAYLAEELFHGKAENDLREMRDAYIEPLAKKMAKFDISREQLDKYLYARHAKERNAHIASINPDMPDGGSGMTNRQADVILEQVMASGKQDQFEQLAAIVDDMLQLQRDMIRAGSLEDDGLIDAWQEQYQFYVPLKGWANDTKEEGRPRTGKGFAISGKESQRALGRNTEAASPVSYVITDLTEKIIRKRKNEVGNALLKLVQDNPNPSYWQVFSDGNPDMDRRITKVRDPVSGQMVDQVKEMPVPMHMLKDQYFTTKKNGKTYFIKMHDPRLMRAMKNLGPESNGALIRTMAGITRLMSSLNTSYSPEFLVSNFARDVQTAVLNLQAEQSLPAGKGKASGQAIAAQTIKDIPTAMRAIYASLRGQTLKGKGAEWQQLFDQFRSDGAKTGWFDMKDLDGQSRDIDNLIAMAKGGAKGRALQFMKSSADLVENLNQSVENAVRLSAYVNSIRAGSSRKQAASLAKNMTVNFNRKGEVGVTLNAIYMFANASIQGTANFARTMGTLKGDGKLKWQNLNNAQRVAIGIVAGAYFIGQANRMAAGEDDDDENWYDKVPDYVKERNLVIMKSLFGGPQDGSYWKIPLPYGYNVFYVLGSAMEAVVSGPKAPTEAAAELSLAVFGSFSPIGFQDSQTVQGMLLKNAAPTVVKPIVDIALNENFMGSSIYSENFPFGTPAPDSALGRRSTPEAYKAVTQWLNEITGGSQFRPGAIDVNPDVLQYVVDYFGGSAYGFFGSKLPDYAYRQATGQEVQASRTPFVSRVVGQVLPYEDTDKFYRRRDEVDQILAEYQSLTPAERLQYKDRDKLALRPMIDSAEDRLKFLRKQRNAVYAMDIPVSERDRRLKEIEARMKTVIDRVNKAYNAID